MIQAFVLLTLGLTLLTLGAESLVRGASRLATALGVSPLFIGLTLVAYGTSSPELVVSTLAALRELPGVAVGNVVGSNIFNTGIVLGLAAVIVPLRCQASLVRREVPLVAVVTIALAGFALGGRLGRLEGGLLLLGLIIYTRWTYREAVRDGGASGSGPADQPVRIPGSRGRSLLYVALGLVLLFAGAHWLVDGAMSLALRFGLSDRVIGLTIVAAGTSLPELATSVVAAFRREPDIAVGNVLGSNIFNVLGILGIAALARPVGVVRELMLIDIPVALLFAGLSIPIMRSGQRVSRGEGLLLVLSYVAYCVALLGTDPTL